jgi:parallel beta-helix repeat protein
MRLRFLLSALVLAAVLGPVSAAAQTRGPQASITCPGGSVAVAAGASIQAAINANPSGTTFCLGAGVHSVTTSMTPKTSNTFVGAFGAILDGTGWVTSDLDAAAFKALNVDVDNVTIRNLVIRNMPQKAVMAYRDFSSGWTVEYSEIYNCKTGIELPSGSTLAHSKIHHCVGTAGDPNPAERGGAYSFNAVTGFTFTNNEIYNNGTEQKFILSTNITATGNYFHNNTGPGFWIDGGGSGSVVANNTCDDNAGPGIYIEIANNVIVRNNACSRNGEGGILLSVSQNVEVFANTLTGNAFGIDLFLDCSRLAESYPPHPNPDLANNDIHDNLTVVGSGQLAVVFTHIGGCEAAYVANTKNNTFTRNAYTVPNNAGAYWIWGNGNSKTWAQWQAIPQDAGGSLGGVGLPAPPTNVRVTASGTRPAGIRAASCSQTDVQAAMNLAIAGQTVLIPAGTCAWTTTVYWEAPANVTLLGSGSLSTVGGGNQTVIVDNIASDQPVLSIVPSGALRIAGLTIRGGSGLTKETGMLKVNGSSTSFRMDHVTINKTTYAPANNGKLAYFGGPLRGVVDSNVFLASSNIGWLHIVNGSDASGDDVWDDLTGFGTSDFLFLEDNQYIATKDTFFNRYQGTMTDCHTGGKFVVRYNAIVASGVGQTHPTGHAGDDRGCRAHEVYGNTVTSPGNWATEEPNFAMTYSNSGPSLVWGNAANQVFKNIVYLNVIRQDNGTYPQGAGGTSGWGYCGTAFNGSGSVWDRNDTASTGEPCIDQPGRGRGDLLTGSFVASPPNRRNSVTGTPSWPNQALEPVYEWLNTASIVAGWGGSYLANVSSGRLAANRDYYVYEGNSSCNPGAGACTAGVGSGTLAQRPASCTTNTSEVGGGVAWWATDQGGNWNTSNGTANDGRLYKCTGTNTWTAYYTPYTYPHPLRSQ